MKELFEAAKQVQDVFEENQWQFRFISGIALQRWAKPRLTNNIDLTLLTGFGDEERYIEKLLDKFQSRIENPKEFALLSRVVLLQTANIGIDVSLGALFFEENAINRATKFEFIKDVSLKTCSAEDLIVYKAFADRSQNWVDVENILSVQTNLDWNYIFEQLTPLVELKEAPEILTKLENLRGKI